MFLATIFQLHDQVFIIQPHFDSMSVCLEFLKAFLVHIDPNEVIGSGCLSPEILAKMGILPA